MKKLVLFVLMLVISLSVFSFAVLAASIETNKEIYAPGETLQADIFGNFIDPLDLNNIYFYRERAIPIIYDIFKLKDKHILYARLPYKEGNYTIKIKDARYSIPDGSSSEELIKQFEIKKTNQTILKVSPGFVVARDDFSITLEANENTQVEAKLEITGETKQVELIQNLEKKVYFSIEGILNYTESNLRVGEYNIPVFIFPEKSEQEIIKETGSFRFNPPELKATILKEQDFSFKVGLLNLGNINLSQIQIFSEISEELNIEINPESISLLETDDEKIIDLIFNYEETGNFSGKIIAVSGELSAELDVEIDVTENQSDVGFESPSYTEQETCSGLGGNICSVYEVCDGTYEFTSEGYCCIGQCTKEKSDEVSSAWIYGLIIIIVIGAGLALLFYFMKKKQKVKPEDFLKRKETNFQKRMKLPQSNQPSKQVRGNLEKI